MQRSPDLKYSLALRAAAELRMGMRGDKSHSVGLWETCLWSRQEERPDATISQRHGTFPSEFAGSRREKSALCIAIQVGILISVVAWDRGYERPPDQSSVLWPP